MSLRLLFEHGGPVCAIHRCPDRLLFLPALDSTASLFARATVELSKSVHQHFRRRDRKDTREIVDVVNRGRLLPAQYPIKTRLIPHGSNLLQASRCFRLIPSRFVHQTSDASAHRLRGTTIFHYTPHASSARPNSLGVR